MSIDTRSEIDRLRNAFADLMQARHCIEAARHSADSKLVGDRALAIYEDITALMRDIDKRLGELREPE